MTLGILCGFEAEAKVARQFTPLVACSGAREEVARQKAEELVQRGAKILMSFGVAGGLANGLTPKSIIIGDRVVDKNGQEWKSDAGLVATYKNALPDAIIGGVYGSPIIIETPEHKNSLCKNFNVSIVDMESHMIAETAARHGLPFIVLRGISDDADAPLPPAALEGINADGTENIPAILKSLMKNPAQLPSLLHFAHNTGVALKILKNALSRTAQIAGG